MGEDFVPTFAAVVITSAGECPSCGQWTKEHFGVQALEKAEWHRVADKWAGFVKGHPVINTPCHSKYPMLLALRAEPCTPAEGPPPGTQVPRACVTDRSRWAWIAWSC